MFVTRQASCTVALFLFAASPAWAQGGPKTLELAGPGLNDVTGPITAVAVTLGPASTGNPPYGVRIDATSGGRRLTCTIHLQTDAEMDRLLSRIGDSRTVGVVCVGHVNKSDASQAFVELWSTAMSAPDRLTITFKP